MTAVERTQIIIDKYRGRATEFTALHTILCLTHHWENNDAIKFRKWIDLQTIAARLDEIKQ